jgi:predicted trehalose synthase
MPIGGDASNTSFVVRSRSAGWIVKLFRRCREGIQPEVELGDFFAAASPWPGTPRLCGWLEYVPADGPLAAASTAIATVHEFAAGYTTGWDRLVGLLSSSPSGEEPLADATGDEVLAIVADLGRATGQMHRALAARPDIPDFAPESTTPAGRQATAMRLAVHAERAVSRALGGSCSMPLAAYGRWDGAELVLEARLGDPNDAARPMICQLQRAAVVDVAGAEALGQAVAQALRQAGGDAILCALSTM